jgi:1-phosphatidylinositol-4-phosphate 5-kinase
MSGALPKVPDVNKEVEFSSNGCSIKPWPSSDSAAPLSLAVVDIHVPQKKGYTGNVGEHDDDEEEEEEEEEGGGGGGGGESVVVNINPVMEPPSVIGERVLPNGDFYVGSWQGNLPEGTGKYLWADGCIYEGEWGRGKKTGKGKFSWPTGATYEGDFMGGYMHGVGTYTSGSIGGTTYKGHWSLNVKHGHGRKTYANGDVYEGFWKQGVQEGFAKYVWASGNEYQGEWRTGSMCGKGILTWASGDKFDGQWLDGLEHGRGIYTWVDGSCYIGNWSRGLKDGKGVFYPDGSLSPDTRLLQNSDNLSTLQQSHKVGHDGGLELRAPGWSRSHSSSSEKSFHVGDVVSRSGELSQHSSYHRWTILESPVGKGPRSDATTPWTGETILEGVEKTGHGPHPPDSSNEPSLFPTVVVREYVQGVLMSELVKENAESDGHKKRRPRKAHKEIKRPGETIFKGHRSYDLMLNLQLGIR